MSWNKFLKSTFSSIRKENHNSRRKQVKKKLFFLHSRFNQLLLVTVTVHLQLSNETKYILRRRNKLIMLTINFKNYSTIFNTSYLDYVPFNKLKLPFRGSDVVLQCFALPKDLQYKVWAEISNKLDKCLKHNFLLMNFW